MTQRAMRGGTGGTRLLLGNKLSERGDVPSSTLTKLKN